jgi:hypothetical protein
MKNKRQIEKRLEKQQTKESKDLLDLNRLANEALDHDREFLDKMFERLEYKYGEYLWK